MSLAALFPLNGATYEKSRDLPEINLGIGSTWRTNAISAKNSPTIELRSMAR
jgi:hypothetical protein